MKNLPTLATLAVVILLGAGCAASMAVEPDDTADALYRDATQPVAARVEDLLSRMTVAEKIGQMALVEKNSVRNKKDIATYGLGALLSGGGGKPKENTPEGWLAMVDDFQSYAAESRLGIPLFYGVDAVHGHGNIPAATIFPHQIGLGAAHDAELVRRIGEITANELAATHITWNFSPTLDVARDGRWGRIYETFGSDTALVSQLGAAYIEGLQSHSTVLATAKHYLGNGAMAWGTSTNPDFRIDQGTILMDEAALRTEHLPPFEAAVEAGVGSVMVSHSSWDGTELAANSYLLTDVLKDELGFAGFVVSDWNGVDEIPGGQYRAVVTAVNAGVDMLMLPYDYRSFAQEMRLALDRGEITSERLDDAVRRILTAKVAAGLFDAQETIALDQIGSAEHRAVAREAVRKSLVLLANTGNTLPVSKSTARIVVAGSSAHNLGRQSGGWTVEWQGIDGNWIPGTTILDGIRSAVSDETDVSYSETGTFAPNAELADVGIAVVGEAPYAEGWGDNANPMLSAEDLLAIARVKAASKRVVVVIVSGRPLDIRAHAEDWDAVVAAWLPGTEGGGVADVLFGAVPFTGTLPVPWAIVY